MRSIMICAPYTVLFRGSNREERDGREMWHVWGEERSKQGFDGET